MPKLGSGSGESDMDWLKELDSPTRAKPPCHTMTVGPLGLADWELISSLLVWGCGCSSLQVKCHLLCFSCARHVIGTGRAL